MTPRPDSLSASGDKLASSDGCVTCKLSSSHSKPRSTTGGNLTAEGGHRPLPRPKGFLADGFGFFCDQSSCCGAAACMPGVKLPAEFRKTVGRISQKELVEKYSCKGGLRGFWVSIGVLLLGAGQRMLISVYGDLFDVSELRPCNMLNEERCQLCHGWCEDRPDKYGPDGPYWLLGYNSRRQHLSSLRVMFDPATRYMTGKDITWALMSGEAGLPPASQQLAAMRRSHTSRTQKRPWTSSMQPA